MKTTPTLILASSSPRRRSLLERLHVPFAISAAEVEERSIPGEDPVEMAKRIATGKARAIAATLVEGIVLAADTMVVSDGRVLGKPADENEAREMLRSLRGRAHQVITGVTLINRSTGQTYETAVATSVWMRDYSDAEIDAYVGSGDPIDKAGAYAIQNRKMHPVALIVGCYYNVVGLPICEVIRGLIRVGYPRDRLPSDKVCRHDLIVDDVET